MDSYSYSKEINRSNITFGEFDLEGIKKMFAQVFEFYNPRVKAEVFDSFCEDFYDLVKDTHTSNERVWRMVITDMLFNYDDRGYLETDTTDNKIKRKQFAIMAKVVIGKLRSDK